LIHIKGVKSSQIDFQGWETIEESIVKTEAYEEELVILLKDLDQFIIANELVIEDCIVVVSWIFGGRVDVGSVRRY